ADLPGGAHHQRLAGRYAGRRLPARGSCAVVGFTGARFDARTYQFQHRPAALLPVRHEILGEFAHALRGPIHGVDHGHGLLQAVPFGIVQPGGGLVGSGVDVLVAEVAGLDHLHQPGLEVDGHGGAVGHGTGEVVDVDHVTEDRAGVALGGVHRGAGEGQQGGVGQRVLQVPGVAVEVVVVAAVGLVDEQDDVGPVGELGVGAAGFLLDGGQPELLQRGEVDAAGAAGAEFLPQFGTTADLPGLFTQQPGAGEGVVELPGELVAVGDHHDRGVVQRRVAGYLGGEELHLHRLARALGVPHDARATVAVHRG